MLLLWTSLAGSFPTQLPAAAGGPSGDLTPWNAAIVGQPEFRVPAPEPPVPTL